MGFLKKIQSDGDFLAIYVNFNYFRALVKLYHNTF